MSTVLRQTLTIPYKTVALTVHKKLSCVPSLPPTGYGQLSIPWKRSAAPGLTLAAPCQVPRVPPQYPAVSLQFPSITSLCALPTLQTAISSNQSPGVSSLKQATTETSCRGIAGNSSSSTVPTLFLSQSAVGKVPIVTRKNPQVAGHPTKPLLGTAVEKLTTAPSQTLVRMKGILKKSEKAKQAGAAGGEEGVVGGGGRETDQVEEVQEKNIEFSYTPPPPSMMARPTTPDTRRYINKQQTSKVQAALGGQGASGQPLQLSGEGRRIVVKGGKERKLSKGESSNSATQDSAIEKEKGASTAGRSEMIERAFTQPGGRVSGQCGTAWGGKESTTQQGSVPLENRVVVTPASGKHKRRWVLASSSKKSLVEASQEINPKSRRLVTPALDIRQTNQAQQGEGLAGPKSEEMYRCGVTGHGSGKEKEAQGQGAARKLGGTSQMFWEH
eukprot:GFUD01040893.1.p1 GENE.GFUD01040893.1~~GFUD01040893.1.p1  ORF type:complete len:517 (+),score=136.24 GFUD01040893.1:223-1551(+)